MKNQQVKKLVNVFYSYVCWRETGEVNDTCQLRKKSRLVACLTSYFNPGSKTKKPTEMNIRRWTIEASLASSPSKSTTDLCCKIARITRQSTPMNYPHAFKHQTVSFYVQCLWEDIEEPFKKTGMHHDLISWTQATVPCVEVDMANGGSTLKSTRWFRFHVQVSLEPYMFPSMLRMIFAKFPSWIRGLVPTLVYCSVYFRPNHCYKPQSVGIYCSPYNYGILCCYPLVN